ncbi:class I SAM-dependent methyltransferase [Solidesulfovibrio sp.]|uniref:class I SAM-dependent methyltransferase n=1 Tax=Solidesulfovibrio sp. TaxID=2910990 RepID=UPI002B1F993D|nr:class I SAM-dependent methyltransferase [Solidesulfovibrio sp.]MEA4856720.1 class I SAM-dependent methyltransferase [Solidesulfovibrio sp.]
MLAHHDISATAFVINVSRAKRQDISLDRYAGLWVTPEAEALWDELAREVYPNDDVSSSLRNRFYLEQHRAFAANHSQPVSVNIAAGFSDYPYLLGSEWRCVETDYPHIVEAKAERTSAWEAEGRLPRRDVLYFGADLVRGVEAVGRELPGWIGGRPALVVLEGITYYLPRPVLARLFALFAAHLPAGSRLAFEHWPPDAATYPVFVRLNAYLQNRFGWAVPAYDLFDATYAAALPGFRLVETTDIAAVEARWTSGRLLADRSARLPIFFCVLEKN